ncbi:MAG: divergent PAP2 family protein [Clostridiales bacterium]|jgi:acid phosphatase family membrane protein YuiD|nr:divergent PAP2 family protein [Clostridiales bacterium]MBQ1296528.1 divergent PAP2 family protein [Clostridiales bacterium]MBQ1571799.1 divergent PAP2 family protein [Clostridiales bacterium]MBQ5767640.1 divergent PAP2 family protein [Clostridiales bacterium]
MDFLLQIITNKILIVGIVSWFLAQVFKCISNLILTKKFSIERLFGDGGMPSGHSATVVSVAVATGLYEGFDTAVFAVAMILAIVVMHDAMNVRYQAGKQAELLNAMADMFEKITGADLPNEEKLKELLGHTPLQVAAGCLLGIATAIIMYLIF